QRGGRVGPPDGGGRGRRDRQRRHRQRQRRRQGQGVDRDRGRHRQPGGGGERHRRDQQPPDERPEQHPERHRGHAEQQLLQAQVGRRAAPGDPEGGQQGGLAAAAAHVGRD